MSAQVRTWHAEPAEAPSAAGLLQKLPTLLRLLGAAALLIAMYSFLTKGWQNGNDLFRYLLMLGHTAALAGIGLASGHWLKEGKGARLLLTLALASVPANFAILGAFIFSQTAMVDAARYPHYVAWSVDTLQTALITSGIALLVLVPLTLLGFTVLARSISKKLSLLFLLSNAALLWPLRDPQLVALLALALTGAILYFSRKTAHGNAAAKTGEGITALALQLLPLAVLTVRSLWLYSIDLFLLTAMSATLFLILRQISLYLEQGSKVRGLMDVMSLIPATATGLWFSATLYDTSLIPISLALPSAGFVTATLIYGIAQRNRRHGDLYRRIAVGVMLLASILNLLQFDNQFAALACILTGLTLLLRGYKVQQRSLFSGGIVLLLTGVSHQLYQLVLHFDLGSWATLAFLGIAAIVIASLIESKGGKFKPLLHNWRENLHGWER